jgi:hypothetical protein
MKRTGAIATVALATLTLAGCLTESRGFLFLTVDDPCSYGLQPDCPAAQATGSATTFTIEGQVVRSPPDIDLAIQIIAANGPDTARVVTGAGGFFSIDAPISQGNNSVFLTADDGIGGSSDRLEFLIVADIDVPGVSASPR